MLMPQQIAMGAMMINGARQPIASLIAPPNTAPIPMPAVKAMIDVLCHIPRYRGGTLSEQMNELIDVQPLPPIPAMTLPRIIVLYEDADAHTRFPIAKIIVAAMKLGFRPKRSLNFPVNGWVAASPIK
jgi:hypothetical protein